VFWTDGDWDVSDSVWKSKQFLTWLYNESPVKNKVIVNDRWGAGLRFKHAGIYTPEYQPDLDFEDHVWEESRGMGYSYGYNRQEDAWDYNSTQSLVLQLIDKVSRGGNFLLDIGPDEHGKIPPIMQERLLQMGDWLKINGEAIYKTSRWKLHSQWSEGNRNYTDRSGDMLLKITIDPEPGYAVKEVFYTYNANTNSLYAILPKYPDNKKLVLKNISLPAGSNISLLSTKTALQWKQVGDNIEVSLPDYNPNTIKAPYAYVVKIENYGRYLSKPKADITYNKSLQPTVTISSNTDGAAIYYTTDGSMPTVKSELYTKPFTLTATTLVKAIAVKDGLISSDVMEIAVRAYGLMKSTNIRAANPGLKYTYYEADDLSMKKMEQLQATKSGIATAIDTKNKSRVEKYGFVFEGYLKINTTALYDFYLSSDDGSILYIDDEVIVNNDGSHSFTEKSDKAYLQAGFHKIKVMYFDGGGGNDLQLKYSIKGGEKVPLPGSMLFLQ
jgi:hypothetical protein